MGVGDVVLVLQLNTRTRVFGHRFLYPVSNLPSFLHVWASMYNYCFSDGCNDTPEWHSGKPFLDHHRSLQRTNFIHEYISVAFKTFKGAVDSYMIYKAILTLNDVDSFVM